MGLSNFLYEPDPLIFSERNLYSIIKCIVWLSAGDFGAICNVLYPTRQMLLSALLLMLDKQIYKFVVYNIQFIIYSQTK